MTTQNRTTSEAGSRVTKRAPLFRHDFENRFIKLIPMDSKMSEKPKYLTTTELARAVRRQPNTIRKSVCLEGHFKGIRPVRLGGKLLWALDQVEALLNEVCE